MQVDPLPLAGALELRLQAFSDERGYFKETYSAQRYRDAGIADEWLQDNVSVSHRGVLRGLHGDPRMSKLVQVLAGEAFDVIADVRPESPTRGRWYGTLLRAGEHRQIYVPRGFVHGFLALSDEVIFLYKQSALYDPASEFGVAWNDPALGIEWPLDGRLPLLSPKDAAHPTLAARRPA
ncbi:MAG TPA: dTDP-4-dehydrorhamnose 3,5-epimerase [Candidatus Acidoferrales bacterium]|nr:dTDP-4-dehydrorhamnose 3,5-epimerase [Candidatus Acidoferrales bacterium]